jgi:hypothetical protein
MRWVRHYWVEDDTMSYYELDDDGWMSRSVTDGQPTSVVWIAPVHTK